MKTEKRTFAEFLKENAAEYGSRPAITCGEQTVSYEELDLATDLCAVKLLQAGVQADGLSL